MAVDERLQQRFREAKEAADARREPEDRPEDVDKGGGPPHDGGMDGFDALVKRVDRLDARMDGVDGRLRAVEVKLGEVSGKLDLLTGQIVSRLPTWWQIPAVIGATVVLLVGLFTMAKHFQILN